MYFGQDLSDEVLRLATFYEAGYNSSLFNSEGSLTEFVLSKRNASPLTLPFLTP